MKTFKGPFRKDTVDMIRSVVTFALSATNLATTQLIAAFYAIILNLETILDTVDDLKQQADAVITGYAAQKRAAKATLVATSTRVMHAVYTYAAATDNNVLANAMQISDSKLSKMSYNGLVSYIQSAINTASPFTSSLADYGVTPLTITAWQAEITALADILSSANNAIAHRKALNEQVQVQLKAAMELIGNEADPLVLQLKLSNPIYYADYFANRKLKPYGHMSTQGRIHIVDVNGHPVATGELFVLGTDRNAFLNENGYALLDYIPFGTHSIRVTTPSGEEEYGPFTFKKGKSLTIHLTLGEFSANTKSTTTVTEEDLIETPEEQQ